MTQRFDTPRESEADARRLCEEADTRIDVRYAACLSLIHSRKWLSSHLGALGIMTARQFIETLAQCSMSGKENPSPPRLDSRTLKARLTSQGRLPNVLRCSGCNRLRTKGKDFSKCFSQTDRVSWKMDLEPLYVTHSLVLSSRFTMV